MSDAITPQAAGALGALPASSDLTSQIHVGHLRNGFAIQVARDISTFPQWPALDDVKTAAKAHIFQYRDHLDIWLKTIGAESSITAFFVSVSGLTGDPVMMLPLGIETRRGLKVLKFLDGGVADYNAPVLFPAADKLGKGEINTIWKSICRAVGPFDIARLEKMPADVGGIKNPLHHLARERWPISGHYLTLDACQRKQLNPKESRRKLRHLAGYGEVCFRVVTEEHEIQPIFDAFLRQKSRRYRETLGRPGFDIPGQAAYYLALTQRFLNQGAQLAYLKVGHEVIATAWNLIAGTWLYYMMAGYEDGKWSKYSPGTLLLEELVDLSGRSGIEIFDFGIGDESYKLKWHCTELPLWSAILPNSLQGWVWLGAGITLRSLKRILPNVVIILLKNCRNLMYAAGISQRTRE